MKSPLLNSMVLCGSLTLSSFGQGTLQITFDGPPSQPSGTQYGVTNYLEAGVSFTPLGPLVPGNQFARNGGGISGYPDNGTAFIQAGTLTFKFTDGSLFGVSSVELAGYSDVVPDFMIEFVGYRSVGGTVTTTFSGTGINFQTFQFGPEFSDLIRVEIPTYGWSLDNLVISVPEPTGCAILFAGGVLLWTQRKFWRLKRNTVATDGNGRIAVSEPVSFTAQ